MAKTAKMSINEFWMRQASMDAPRIQLYLFSDLIIIRCATHRWMRHASRGVLTAGNCTVESYCNRDWMRHASRKIKGRDFTTRQRLLGCATHPLMLHTSKFSDFQSIKGSETSLFRVSCHFRTPPFFSQSRFPRLRAYFHFQREIKLFGVLILRWIWRLRSIQEELKTKGSGSEISTETSLLRVFLLLYSSFLVFQWVWLLEWQF